MIRYKPIVSIRWFYGWFYSPLNHFAFFVYLTSKINILARYTWFIIDFELKLNFVKTFYVVDIGKNGQFSLRIVNECLTKLVNGKFRIKKENTCKIFRNKWDAGCIINFAIGQYTYV